MVQKNASFIPKTNTMKMHRESIMDDQQFNNVKFWINQCV